MILHWLSAVGLSTCLFADEPPAASGDDAEVPTGSSDTDGTDEPDGSGGDDVPSTSAPPTDERGDPVLDYADQPNEGEGFEYAEETPPSEGSSLEFAPDAPPPEEEVSYTESSQQAAPAPEAIERQSNVDLSEDADPKADPNYASPQRFAIEMKFGPYLPDVDARYSGSGLGPYAEIFGETNKQGVANDAPKKGLMAKLGFEWQFYNLGGPFLLGTSVGLFQDRADALVAVPDANADSVRSSADRVRFNVVPLSLDIGYRFELLADRYKVPLVPYVKGGLAYGFWWSKAGSKKVTVNQAGVKGSGGSIGWQASLGMMLRLDFLEGGAARELDRATGINHTYIFGEYQFQRLDGFGGALEKVSVGDDTFYLGLAIEF